LKHKQIMIKCDVKQSTPVPPESALSSQIKVRGLFRMAHVTGLEPAYLVDYRKRGGKSSTY